MDDDELEALLQEALTISGGDIERVARVALKELVNRMIVINDLQKRIAAIPTKRPVGRPPRAGLRASKEYRGAKPLGAPNRMGLGVPTRELAEMADRIKKAPAYVFDHEPTAKEIANIPPLTTNKEAAARVLSIFDPMAASRDEKDIKNIAKRMK